MSLLAPLYLLGALAIAIPIILHRRKQRPDKTTLFSTLLFLEPTPPKSKTKTKIEHPLLLLLRCLAILLVALCFARPLLFNPDNKPDFRQRHLLLVDTSASMQRGDLREVLQDSLKDTIETLKGNNAEAALMTFDRETKALSQFTDAFSSLAQEAPEPTWHGTDIGDALCTAAEFIQQAPNPPETAFETGGTIHLFSDLQQGADLAGLTGKTWPPDIRVVLHSLTPSLDATDNASIEAAPALPGKPEEARIRISNAANSSASQFTLAWKEQGTEDNATSKAEPQVGTILQIAPGESVILPAPPKPDAATTTLELTGDSNPFDNQLHIAPPPARPIHILHIRPRADDTPKGTHYYLQKAFQPTQTLLPQIASLTPDAVSPKLDFTQNHLIVAETPIPASLTGLLEDYHQTGRTILILLQDHDHLPGLTTLLRLPNPGSVPAIPAKDYHLFENLDTSHPVLAPFQDPRFRDFSKLHIWKHRPWPLNMERAQILAKFDDGLPAMVHVPHEKGNTLVLTTSWAPGDSQLALSTKFIPLLYSILEYSIGNLQPQTRYTTDTPIDLSQFPRTTSITAPNGENHAVREGQNHFQPELPGIHRIQTGEHSHTLAINLPPKESDLEPMNVAALLAMVGGPAAGNQEDQNASASPLPHLEASQKMWKWFLLAALLVLAMETILAARLTRSA